MKKIYTILFSVKLNGNEDINSEKVLAEDNKDAERIIRKCYSDYKDEEIQFSKCNPLRIENVEDILKKNKIIVEFSIIKNKEGI